MHGSTVRRHKVFFAWQDEREEGWLRHMARDEGLHLVAVKPPVFYFFRRGEHADYAYRLDFQTVPKRDRSDYLQLFEDGGWEHVGEMNSWHYFRRPVVGGEAPEIFTDPDSKAQKYRRLLALHVVFLAPLITLMTNPLWRRHPGPAVEALRLVLLLVMVFWTYSTLRILGRVGQLTKRTKRA
jgi:hypothetical protein